MNQTQQDLKDASDLGEKITKLLPVQPDNVGVPILALKLATADYVEYVRSNIPKEQIEMFESLLHQTDITVDQLIGTIMDVKK